MSTLHELITAMADRLIHGQPSAPFANVDRIALIHLITRNSEPDRQTLMTATRPLITPTTRGEYGNELLRTRSPAGTRGAAPEKAVRKR